jgi:hypothetical protein
MIKEESLEVIKGMKRTFPNPLVVIKNNMRDDFILIGCGKKAYIACFSLIKKSNERFYPEYKRFTKDFKEENGLLDYENFVEDIFNPLESEIILDDINFENLHT